MSNPPGDTFSPAVLWNLIALSVPIVAAVVIATYKILSVLRAEIRSEIAPVINRFGEMETRLLTAIRDLWDHSASQDVRIDTVTASHNRLKGSHDAIMEMGGHGERRSKPRLPKPHCTEPE